MQMAANDPERPFLLFRSRALSERQTSIAGERNSMRSTLRSDSFENHGSMVANSLFADTKPLRDLVVVQSFGRAGRGPFAVVRARMH
jgi:hypothetical protein